jgi:hypothetical protein
MSTGFCAAYSINVHYDTASYAVFTPYPTITTIRKVQGITLEGKTVFDGVITSYRILPPDHP